MKNIYLLVFAVFGLLLASCKDKDKDPKPAVGSIRCVVTPAGAVSGMRVTAGGTIFEAAPDENNTLVIGNLPPGQYTVSFRTNPNFKEPANRMAEVVAGQETNLGTVSIEKIIDTGNFSATVNGSGWVSPLPVGTLNNGSLIITATKPNLTGSTEVITLILPNFTGVGSYSGPANAMATFTAATITGSMQNWASSMGACQVNVTGFNATTKQATGTFNFTAAPVDANTTGTKTITNGAFTNVSFQ